MQLPRGTFRYIKKATKLGGILEDLELMKFSGICAISFGSAQGSLVYKSGKRILAEFCTTSGDAAWDEFQKISGENVDASVSTMDDTQIELSLEFNKSCRIGKGGKADQFSLSPQKTDRTMIKKSLAPLSGDVLFTPVKNLQRSHIQEKPAPRPQVSVETLHAPDPSKMPGHKLSPPEVRNPSATIPQKAPEFVEDPKVKKNPEDEARNTADSDSKNFESDIEAIETMDVDIITNKIRGECKTLIKQLRLEHLNER
jgi:hypothetical protein